MTQMFLTPTAVSNLKIKDIVSKVDPRQAIGVCYEIPDEKIRLLAAKLILEEALETVYSLGIRLSLRRTFAIERGIDDFYLEPGGVEDLEGIIDGCCDVNFVATGCLMACGVPDKIHMEEVCRANEDKFPGGKCIIDQTSGKYLKPLNWFPPDHKRLMEAAKKWGFNLQGLIPKE